LPGLGGKRPESPKEDDVADLKRQLAELQARLDKIDKE
jgi:hypothetical protein